MKAIIAILCIVGFFTLCLTNITRFKILYLRHILKEKGLYLFFLYFKIQIYSADGRRVSQKIFSKDMDRLVEGLHDLIVRDSTLKEIEKWNVHVCLDIMEFIKRSTVEPLILGNDELKREQRGKWLEENIHILNSPSFIETVLIVTKKN